MTLNEYQIAALRTAGPIQISEIRENGQLLSVDDLSHGLEGLVTETGELMDVLKKHRRYGKEIDWVNVKEEIGDVAWYVAMLCRAAGVSLEEVCRLNIAKLEARFPNKFTNERALTRDLETERKRLEG